MGYAIRVKSNPEDNQYLFERVFSSEGEFQDVKNYCVSRETIGFFGSTLITVRTNTLQNLAIDFFFPTLINHALKTNDFALKIFKAIAFALLDICTIFFRLSTFPFRIADEKCSKQSHLFYQYLLRHQVPAEALDDHVFVELKYVNDINAVDLSTIVTVKKTCNFIELHKPEGPHRDEGTWTQNVPKNLVHMVFQRAGYTSVC